MTQHTDNTIEKIPEGVDASTLMDMSDPTETIVIDIAEAMNRAAAIGRDIKETLDLYDPHGESVDNANLTVMALSHAGMKINELAEHLSDALNQYIPARAKMQIIKDEDTTDTLEDMLHSATRTMQQAQELAEETGIDLNTMDSIYKAKSFIVDATAKLYCAASVSDKGGDK